MGIKYVPKGSYDEGGAGIVNRKNTGGYDEGGAGIVNRKNTGGYDEGGLTNPNGLTTKARANASKTDLGGKKAIVTRDKKVGGNLSRGNPKFKYPLHNEDAYPARLKFSLFEVKAYTIDPKKAAQIYDIPLLGIGGKKIAEEETTDNTGGYDEAGLTNPNGKVDQSRTKKVGGTGGYDEAGLTNPNGRTGKVDQSRKKSKEQEASFDAAAGAPSSTNVKTRRVPGAPQIQLQFPASLQFADAVNYGTGNLGPMGSVALAGANSGSTLLQSVGGAIEEGVESIFGLIKGSISGAAAQVAAARVNQFIPNEGIRTAISSAIQTTINPGTRTLFQAPAIRNFSFTFKLIATSMAEANQIENIVNTFRTEMYPESIDIGSGIPAGYKFPNLFKIEFELAGAEMKVPNILFCYLRSAQTSYNSGTSGVFHTDGQPTEVELTLAFQEYRALSRQDIEEGF